MVLLATYLGTAAPDLTFWDASEFVTAAQTLGVPHPPGTPLWVLMGHLAALAFREAGPARAVTLLSVLASALAGGLGAAMATRWIGARGAVASAVGAGVMLSVWNNATEAEVMVAADMARCREFIEALPEGFNTMVGDRGVKLSGGQRQRLAIARALLKDVPILLLDEATSALDTESEQAIQAALDRLMAGRTTIAIAHRLSTLQRFDRIIVMDRGRIVDDGSPRELAHRPGPYRDLLEKQRMDHSSEPA